MNVAKILQHLGHRQDRKDRVALNQADPVAEVSPAVGDVPLFRKLARRIVPFLFLCYVGSFIDRINIGFAQLQMKHDLGFTDAMYGLSATMFYVGYVLCGVPSNMLLARFGARKTFSGTMLLSGIASTGMMFATTPAVCFGLRFVLGVFEAGLFPGIILYLTYWFPANRRALIMATFIAGVAVSGVLEGFFSGWIMHGMAGTYGLAGWQWMFAFEGLPTFLLGLMAWVYLVDSPTQAKWLSERERTRLSKMLGEPETLARAKPIVRSLGANLKVYLFAFVYFTLTCASLIMNFWIPLIIRDFGVRDIVTISLLSVVPNAIGIIGLIAIAKHSDRADERRRHFAFCTFFGAAALAALTLHLESLPLMLGFLSIACLMIYSAIPIFWAVPSVHLPKQHAAAGIALVNSLGITSGIVSPWAIGIVRTRTGSIDGAIYVVALLLVLSGITLFISIRPTTKG